MVDSIIFWAFAIVSITAALGAITCRSIINAALCLIAVFFSIAGFFLLNNADFLAIAQIIIYAVGLTIIMLFAIMFTGDKAFAKNPDNRNFRLVNRVVAVYAVALLFWLVSKLSFAGAFGPGPEIGGILATKGSTPALGLLLFKDYALPFELASILLLAAMIGAIVIAKKRFTGSSEDLQGEMRLPLDTSSAPSEEASAAWQAERMGASPESAVPENKSDEPVGAK